MRQPRLGDIVLVKYANHEDPSPALVAGVYPNGIVVKVFFPNGPDAPVTMDLPLEQGVMADHWFTEERKPVRTSLDKTEPAAWQWPPK